MPDFPIEFGKPFQLCFKMFNKSNIYFFDDIGVSSLRKYWAVLLIIPCSTLFMMSLSMSFMRLVAEGKDFQAIIESLPVVIVVIQGTFKALVVVPKRKQIGRLIKETANLWPADQTLSDRQVPIKHMHLKRLNFSVNLFYWMNTLGLWQYILTPLAEVVFRKLLLAEDVNLQLPFGYILPFDPTESWPSYLGTYLFQIYGIIKLLHCLLASEILMVTSCAHVSTLFTLLQDDLLRTKNHFYAKNAICKDNTLQESKVWDEQIGVEDSASSEIRSVVKRHQELIRISKAFDEIYNRIIFVDLLFATVTICFFGFVAKVARGPSEIAKNFVGVVATILPIFNICYYGQLLSDTSAACGASAYTNMWYEEDKKFKTIILFIIVRSQKPCSISSLYTPITLSTFTKVLSSAWSYFSLMSSVYRSEE